jgi:hypothetical protein
MVCLVAFSALNTLAQTAGSALPAGTIQLQSPFWLMNPFIRQDIGMTDQQMMELARIQARLTNAFNRQLEQISNVTPAVRDARVRELTNEYNSRFGAAADTILTPQQEQQLQQMQQFQLRRPYWYRWR